VTLGEVAAGFAVDVLALVGAAGELAALVVLWALGAQVRSVEVAFAHSNLKNQFVPVLPAANDWEWAELLAVILELHVGANG
jgi:hypothetical protein